MHHLSWEKKIGFIRMLFKLLHVTHKTIQKIHLNLRRNSLTAVSAKYKQQIKCCEVSQALPFRWCLSPHQANCQVTSIFKKCLSTYPHSDPYGERFEKESSSDNTESSGGCPAFAIQSKTKASILWQESEKFEILKAAKITKIKNNTGIKLNPVYTSHLGVNSKTKTRNK